MTATVLLADASQTIRALARLTLASESIHLVTASGGHQALEALRTERPDVVIADARLPDVDGYELCRLVRERAPDVRFVLMTPEYLAVDEPLAAEVGVTATLRKPFERRTLLAAIAEPGRAAGAPGAVPAPAAAHRHEPPRAATPTMAMPTPVAAAPSAEAVAEAVAGAVERLLPAALESLLPAALERLLPDALARALPSIVERALPSALPPLVNSALPGHIEAPLRDAVTAQLGPAIDTQLGPAIAAQLGPAIAAQLGPDGAEMRSLVEPVVWKSVPALAEQLIKEEIARLTEEVDDR